MSACEPGSIYWELNSGPLKVQQVPSLQPRTTLLQLSLCILFSVSLVQLANQHVLGCS